MNLINNCYRESKDYAIANFEFSNNYSKNIIVISGAISGDNQPPTEVTKFRGCPRNCTPKP